MKQADVTDIMHHFSSGVYAKQATIPKGSFAIQHKHKHDHMSILASGRVIVYVEEDSKEYKAPACITIEAGKNHGVEALEDSVWFCIHATEETDPNKVDHVVIAKGE
jgi:quercetin dioxygenase-like cupin family protein